MKINTDQTLTNIKKEHTDRSLGFEVHIRDAPLRLMRGEWVLAMNHHQLCEQVLCELVLKHAPLNGAQVRFIRHRLRLKVDAFGARCGVTAAEVQAWEARDQSPAQMSLATEWRLRSLILDELIPLKKLAILGRPKTAEAVIQAERELRERIWDALQHPQGADHLDIRAPAQDLAS